LRSTDFAILQLQSLAVAAQRFDIDRFLPRLMTPHIEWDVAAVARPDFLARGFNGKESTRVRTKAYCLYVRSPLSFLVRELHWTDRAGVA
jgi:hypothetical protein